MRIQEERRVEKEWRQQEIYKRRREDIRRRAMEKRKCFGCRKFGYIVCHCRDIEKEGSVQMLSNKFKVLRSRAMQRREESERKVGKDRKKILKEERLKRVVVV